MAKPKKMRMQCAVLGHDSIYLDYEHALGILRIESKREKKGKTPEWGLHPESGYDFVNDEIVKRANIESTGGEAESISDK